MAWTGALKLSFVASNVLIMCNFDSFEKNLRANFNKLQKSSSKLTGLVSRNSRSSMLSLRLIMFWGISQSCLIVLF